jgi:hypothetical protein
MRNAYGLLLFEISLASAGSEAGCAAFPISRASPWHVLLVDFGVKATARGEGCDSQENEGANFANVHG